MLGRLIAEAERRRTRLTIHVERQNPALRLYERLGFRLAEDKGVYLFLERLPGPASAASGACPRERLRRSPDPAPPKPPAIESDGAYAAVEAPDAWHLAALVCFAASLAARPLAHAIAPFLPTSRYRFLLPLAIILGASTLGCALALAGMRKPAIRGASKLALFLNGVALALALLALAAGFWIFYRK